RSPATRVAIDFSSPRTSAGASGLGSNVSSCGGPPVRNRSTQRFARPNPWGDSTGGVAVARRSDGSANPPTAPRRRKLRRVGPRIFSTRHLPLRGVDAVSIPRQTAASTILRQVAQAGAGFALAVEAVVADHLDRGLGVVGGGEGAEGLPAIADG